MESCANAKYSRAKAEKLQAELMGTESLVVKADLTKEADVKRSFRGRAEKIQARGCAGGVNAGFWETRDVPLHEMSLKQWRGIAGPVC